MPTYVTWGDLLSLFGVIVALMGILAGLVLKVLKGIRENDLAHIHEEIQWVKERLLELRNDLRSYIGLPPIDR